MIPWILSKWPYRILLASAASTGALLLPNHPDDVRWSGRQCLLSGTFAPATGAAEVGLDLDGDGSPDLWRSLERDGSYVVAIAAERIATEAIRAVARDKDGRPVGAESFSLNRLAEEDMANALVESGRSCDRYSR